MKIPLIKYGQLRVKMYRGAFDDLSYLYKRNRFSFTQYMEQKAFMLRLMYRRKKK